MNWRTFLFSICKNWLSAYFIGYIFQLVTIRMQEQCDEKCFIFHRVKENVVFVLSNKMIFYWIDIHLYIIINMYFILCYFIYRINKNQKSKRLNRYI